MNPNEQVVVASNLPKQFEVLLVLALNEQNSTLLLRALNTLDTNNQVKFLENLTPILELLSTELHQLETATNEHVLHTLQLMLRFLDKMVCIPDTSSYIQDSSNSVLLEKMLNSLICEVYEVAFDFAKNHKVETIQEDISKNFQLLINSLKEIILPETAKKLEKYSKDTITALSIISYLPKPSISKLNKKQFNDIIQNINKYEKSVQVELMERYLKKYLNYEFYYSNGQLHPIIARLYYKNPEIVKSKTTFTANNKQWNIKLVDLFATSDLVPGMPFFPYEHQTVEEFIEFVFKNLEDTCSSPINSLFIKKVIFDTAIMQGRYSKNSIEDRYTAFREFGQHAILQRPEYKKWVLDMREFYFMMDKKLNLLNPTTKMIRRFTNMDLATVIAYKGEEILITSLLKTITTIKQNHVSESRKIQMMIHEHACDNIVTIKDDEMKYNLSRNPRDIPFQLDMFAFFKINDAPFYHSNIVKNFTVSNRLLETIITLGFPKQYSNDAFFVDVITDQLKINRDLQSFRTLTDMLNSPRAELEERMYLQNKNIIRGQAYEETISIVKLIVDTAVSTVEGLDMLFKEYEIHAASLLQELNEEVSTLDVMNTVFKQFSSDWYTNNVQFALMIKVIPEYFNVFCSYHLPNATVITSKNEYTNEEIKTIILMFNDYRSNESNTWRNVFRDLKSLLGMS